MPHFVVDCSESLLAVHDGDTICQNVHAAANASDLYISDLEKGTAFNRA